ncbi:hypothetical protein GE061_007490 [Apolygus lucorum]|uniref:Uncharacterized protein n=1 Tax=Apolygus lucorum TaxID=248454 RepID=A0A6A4J0J9_APOLU|nr:hypothetical protein GE061_007490 [Apolygus lucorum]
MSSSVDIETLINAIRERPCIWDKTRMDYKDRTKIANSWKEIFSLLHDEFYMLSENDKITFGSEVQKKWNNIRDSFRKYLMQVKHSHVSVIKKYVYYEKLTFLNKIYDFEDSKTKNKRKLAIKSESDDGESVSNFESRSGYECGETGDLGYQMTFHSEASRSDQETSQNQQDSTAFDDFGAFAETYEHDTNVQPWKRRRADESSHMLFFRGIIPHLRDFGHDETISFQMGVLQLIKDVRLTRNKPTLPNNLS